MKRSHIAILGANSHIARGLIDNFQKDKGCQLHLYTRSPAKLRRFLHSIGASRGKDCCVHKGYRDFSKRSFDVMINCVGVGTLRQHKGDYTQYFTVNEAYDNLVMGHLLTRCPKALYVSFSSGAVYGKHFKKPAQEKTLNRIAVNHISPQEYYALSRLYAEAKHRAFKKFRIVDLRLFSYVSRFIDLEDGYFITEILKCILNNKILITDNVNIIRDYVHPLDLFAVIKRCMSLKNINAAFDVMSTKPVSKREILKYFSSRYGLRFKVKETSKYDTATGLKKRYYSRYHRIRKLGYKPKYSAMDTIQLESEALLSRD